MRFYVVLELFEANLFDFIRTQDLQDKIKIKVENVLDGVSQGLAELHHCQITLNNLKPNNILLSRGNRNARVVVSDLGHSVKQPSQTGTPCDKDLEVFANIAQFCLVDAGKTAQNWEECIKKVYTRKVEVAKREQFLATS
ncbi:hypothetical protein B9Z55_027911 [Caenorhabditis nigoni]|uniref:Protein kinase domain-containing protein n=1 Tax=Caenorhabditis nigoni TaxID=1611254 RepID=A0A2G5SEH5_9PELO|nr:hypothetical protein B9Z55_027911 [Caenorhabditis nigoni]